jgi:hypothetical protein
MLVGGVRNDAAVEGKARDGFEAAMRLSSRGEAAIDRF